MRLFSCVCAEFFCEVTEKRGVYVCFLAVFLSLFSDVILAKKLRVMTWNILASEYTDIQANHSADRFGQNPVWADRLPLISKVIRMVDPNIIGFQEDMPKQSNDLLRMLSGGYKSVSFDQAQALTYGGNKLLGSIFYKPMEFKEVESGTFTVLSARATWVRLQDRRDPEIRYVVFNFHWLSAYHARQAVSSVLEMLRLARGDKVIALGDFNAPTSLPNASDSNALNVSDLLHSSGFKEISTRNTIASYFVEPNSLEVPDRRQGLVATIDGIFLAGDAIRFSSDLERWGAGTGALNQCVNCQVSDHYAVVADFSVGSVNDLAIVQVIANLLLSEK